MPATRSNPPKKQITIKAVPVSTAETMVRLAAQRGQTHGEWIADLVSQAEARQAMDRVEFPSAPQPPEERPHVEDSLPQPPSPTFSMAELAAAMEAAATIAKLTKQPVPETMQRLAFTVLAKQLRQAKRQLVALEKAQAAVASQGNTAKQIGHTVTIKGRKA